MEKKEKIVRLCLREGRAELVEKKSRFLSRVAPVASEEEALELLQRVRREHRDARHHCYAYVLGETERCSDDGEPAKTAGVPILELLRRNALQNVCAVVTRYFGGTLLGTGGLVRAYSGAAAAALKAALIAERRRGVLLSCEADYSLYEAVRRMAEEEGLPAAEAEFGAFVTLRLLIPEEKLSETERRLTELSNGRIRILGKMESSYCAAEGSVRIVG